MHLLDFPDYILETIFHNLTSPYASSPNPPLPCEILELSSTCKRLRRLSSTALPTDAIFRPFFPHLHRHQIGDCPHLSTDPTQPVTTRNNSFPACKGKPCQHLHRLLAWYSLSIPGLTSINFDFLSYHVPMREALAVLTRLQTENSVLKDIKIGNNYHLQRVNNPLILSLKQLLTQSAHRLKAVSLCLEDTDIVDTVLGCDLPKLEHLCMKFNDVSGNFSDQLTACKRIIQNAEEAGACVRKLTLRGQAGYLEHLGEICGQCKELNELNVGLVNGRAPFPRNVDVDALGVKQMYLWCFEMGEDELDWFAKQIIRARKLTQVHLHFSKMQSLVAALEKYGEPLQQKIWSM